VRDLLAGAHLPVEASVTLAAAAIAFDDAGRVLVIQRGRPPGEGLWTVPGGRVERGESFQHTVVREVREETGLEVTCGPLVEVIERSGPGYDFQIHDYLAVVCGGALRPGDDARDVRWVTDDELATLPTTEGLLPVIARARDMRACPLCNATALVYADDDVIAILEPRPIARGHLVVAPRTHRADIASLVPYEAGFLGRATSKLSAALQRAMGCERVYLAAVGEEVRHAHVHLIPRGVDDPRGFGRFAAPRGILDDADVITAAIRAAL
jgi:ADP-ribose pyrophosphatase YjhB (NUDIX family)/diadenosine tetraphosphate (Ap4A) HIT family hydrolase